MNTTVYITSPGESEVGIRPSESVIHFDADLTDGIATRKELRDAIRKFFVSYDLHGDSRVAVRFMDECDYCGKKMVSDAYPNSPKFTCNNPDCILNQPQEENPA